MTVKKQPDGRWLADVQPIRGQRFRKLFKTKAEAQRYEQYITANKAADPAWNPKAQDRRRLSELVGLWFDLHGHMLKDGERRKAKLDALCVRLRDPIAIKLDPATYAHDRRLRAEAGITPKTLNNELGYIRAVFNELRGLGQIDYANPLELMKPYKIEERELSWLTQEQIADLLTAIREGCDNPHVEHYRVALPGHWCSMVRGGRFGTIEASKWRCDLQQDQIQQGANRADPARAGSVHS